jgi:diaminopimelate epimerase
MRPSGLALALDLGVEARAFALMHGTENTIAVVDCGERLPERRPELAVRLRDAFPRRVDGVAFVVRERGGPRMVFHDNDGTNATMCGNGLRCVARYCHDAGLIDGDGFVLTDDGPKRVRVRGAIVRVTLGEPREWQVVDEGLFVFTGVAHLVVPVAKLVTVDVAAEGRRLRSDARLAARVGHPEGLHVDFVDLARDSVFVRTYEVGVEDETMSCGTGAAAAAYAAHRQRRRPFPIDVETRGGPLTVTRGPDGLELEGATEYLLRA